MKQLTVVKIGGKVISDPVKLSDALQSFSQINGTKILVHGGGSEASMLAERMGVEVQMAEGRRITEDEMISIVTMVYGGLVNKRIVASLQALNINGLGLSGADGNSVLSHRRPIREIDYGHVGDVENVNGVALHNLLATGFVPVFCALTHDGEGNMLNTNADTIAFEIAREMSKSYQVRLLFTFELPGVLADISNEQSVISKISSVDFVAMQARGEVSEGMIPKIHNALEASKGGVAEVFIGQYCRMAEPEKGTQICYEI